MLWIDSPYPRGACHCWRLSAQDWEASQNTWEEAQTTSEITSGLDSSTSNKVQGEVSMYFKYSQNEEELLESSRHLLQSWNAESDWQLVGLKRAEVWKQLQRIVCPSLVAVAGRQCVDDKDDLLLWCHCAARACQRLKWWQIIVQVDCFPGAWVTLYYRISGRVGGWIIGSVSVPCS